jgi:hypothetical protein
MGSYFSHDELEKMVLNKHDKVDQRNADLELKLALLEKRVAALETK